MENKSSNISRSNYSRLKKMGLIEETCPICNNILDSEGKCKICEKNRKIAATTEGRLDLTTVERGSTPKTFKLKKVKKSAIEVWYEPRTKFDKMRAKFELSFAKYKSEPVKIDSLFVFLQILFAIACAWTFQYFNIDDENAKDFALRNVILMVLFIAGITLYLLVVDSGWSTSNYSWRNDERITKDFLIYFTCGFVLMMALSYIWGTNPGSILLMNLQVDANGLFFSVLAANAEEVLFTLLIATTIIAISNNWIELGLLWVGVSILFSGFHYVVYGLGAMMGNLQYLFFMRFIWFGIFFFTKRPSIVVFLHMLNNILSLDLLALGLAI